MNPGTIQVPCAADDHGGTCARPTVMVRPVPLCAPHKAELALAIVPDLLRDQVAATNRFAAASGTPELRDDLIAEAEAVPHLPLLDAGQHQPVVYFIANGGRVKIGFTTNLKSRLASLALRADGVLLALDGGPDLERALHARFAVNRDGNTEWFELSPDVFRYISARKNPAHTRGTAHLPRHTSVSDFVRALLAEGASGTSEIVSAAIDHFGPDVNPNSVRRLIRRHRDKDGGGYL